MIQFDKIRYNNRAARSTHKIFNANDQLTCAQNNWGMMNFTIESSGDRPDALDYSVVTTL